MQKKYKQAFSLVELSIVILIISILLAGALGVSKTSINNSKTKITNERMDILYKALSNFVALNKRLPCPAMLTVAKGGSSGNTTTPNNIRYGEESGTSASTKVVGTGVCAQVFNSTNRANLAYGAVPTLALGLGPDMAEDGFGTKFSYVVDKRFTKASSGTVATDGFEITQSLPSESVPAADLLGFSVYDEGNPIQILPNYNGILLLISHGANKLGGFNASGTAQNPVSTIVAEQDNSCSGSQGASCTIAPYAGYDQWFGKTSLSQNFDDIILFKTKAQLVRDAGLEFIMCPGIESTISTSGTGSCIQNGGGTSQTWANANYSPTTYLSSSNAGVCSRSCGKYGTWGTPSISQSTQKPAFFAYLTSQIACSNFNSGINKISFTNKIFDNLSSFSAGIFTAPVAGIYNFTTTIVLDWVANPNQALLELVITGSEARTYRLVDINPNGVKNLTSPFPSPYAGNSVSFNGVASNITMGLNDTAQLNLNISGDTGCHLEQGVSGTIFSGNLAF